MSLLKLLLQLCCPLKADLFADDPVCVAERKDSVSSTSLRSNSIVNIDTGLSHNQHSNLNLLIMPVKKGSTKEKNFPHTGHYAKAFQRFFIQVEEQALDDGLPGAPREAFNWAHFKQANQVIAAAAVAEFPAKGTKTKDPASRVRDNYNNAYKRFRR